MVELKAEIEALKKEIDKKEKLLKKFPDLELCKDRWNKKFFMSKEVNSKAEKADLWHSCGCCPDSTLYVNPYIEYKGERIYSNPMLICIGERNEYGESMDKIDRGWEDEMRAKGVTSEKVFEYLRDEFKDTVRYEVEGAEVYNEKTIYTDKE